MITSPDFASAPGAGSVEITIPSWVGSVTGSYTIDGVRPALVSSDSAVDCVCPVTSGTCVDAGPFDTESVIFVPRGTAVPCGGSSATTVPGAMSDCTSTRPTWKPCPCRADCAFLYGCPVTSGTGTGFAPRETLMRTTVPLITE